MLHQAMFVQHFFWPIRGGAQNYHAILINKKTLHHHTTMRCGFAVGEKQNLPTYPCWLGHKNKTVIQQNTTYMAKGATTIIQQSNHKYSSSCFLCRCRFALGLPFIVVHTIFYYLRLHVCISSLSQSSLFVIHWIIILIILLFVPMSLCPWASF